MTTESDQFAAMEIHRGENLPARIGEIHREISNPLARGQDLRDAIAYLIDGAYGEACFAASDAMASRLGPQALACANLFAANIARTQVDLGVEACLSHAIERIFFETYGESPDASQMNQMAGILTSLASLVHPGRVELLGMLAIQSGTVVAKRIAASMQH